jgi:hypothetical protein
LTLIQTKSLPKGKGFFLSWLKEKSTNAQLSISAVSQDLYFSVQNDI